MSETENQLLNEYGKLIEHFNKCISEKKYNMTLREFLETLVLED